MRVTPAKIPMHIWKNDCNRGKLKFNAAAAQCCIYAVKDKRIREMRNGMNTIEKNINVIEISDISAPELDVFARMTETQLRSKLEPEKGIFIAESPTVIRIALDAGYEPLSLLVEKKHVAGQAADIIERTAGIPVYTAETQLLSKLTGYPLTRGVFCAMRRKPPLSAESVCGGASRIAVLDGIVDSTNIGAIFRSAAALGMDAVLLSPTCCDPLCRRAIRVSMGTVFQIPWARLQPDEEGNRFGRLKALGFRLAATALKNDSVSIDDPRLAAEPRLAVVMGTEGTGLEQSAIDSCDYTVMIPMHHGVDSLNVAAASAVAFWQLGRRTENCRNNADCNKND